MNEVKAAEAPCLSMTPHRRLCSILPQRPGREYVPNPKSTCEIGESYGSTGMARLAARTAEDRDGTEAWSDNQELVRANDDVRVRRL
jgi:hypothetical protein